MSRKNHRLRPLAVVGLILLLLLAAGALPALAQGGPGMAIHDVQGAGHLSPYAGEDVTGVHGIVTTVTSRSFYMQTPDDQVDEDLATSEGILVFTSSQPQVSTGDEVMVDGSVSEFYSGGFATGNLSITELTRPTVTVVSSGNPIPSPTVIGDGGRVPPDRVIDNNSDGDANEKAPFDPANEGLDFYESMEGMLVQVNDAVAVGPTSSFGEIPIVGDNGAHAGLFTTSRGLLARPAPAPQAQGYIRGGDFNPERIHLDDAIVFNEPKVNVGDHFDGPIVGVLDYSFGNFKLLNIAPLPAVTPANLQPEVSPASASTELRVATFNVLNLSPAAGAAKFQALAAQIVQNLGAPDILGLQEIQDNSGPTDDGVVTASRTFSMLIAAITSAGGPAYEYREIAPQNNQDGGAPGANIRVGLLFRPDRVTFVDRPGGAATMGTTVRPGPAGPELTYNPGRVDPTNPVWSEDATTGFEGTRKPLAGEFLFNGRKLFVIVNHLKSKTGDSPLFGRIQPPELVTEPQRVAQAQVVNAFAQSILDLDPNANVIVLGDMNDFEFSPPLQALKGDSMAGGANLTDLIDLLPESDRYTYLYEGNSEVLDHILISEALQQNHLTGADIVHMNAEFTPAQQASDHDAVLATFDFKYPAYALPANAATRFRGYVRRGSPDAPRQGLPGVTVKVYGRNDGAARPGTLIQSRITDGSGFYNLYILPEPRYSFDFYLVTFEAPAGMIGTGIVSEDGFVLSPTMVEHFQPSTPFNVIHLNDAYFSPPPPTTYQLTVLHNNDGESQLLNAGAGLEDFGGMARFATVMMNLKAAGESAASALATAQVEKAVVTVTSGDNFLAGPQFNASLTKGVPYYDSIGMHYIGYDAMALGNHDFDFGPDVTADFIDSFGLPLPSSATSTSLRSMPLNPNAPQYHEGGPVFVSANLDFSEEPRLQAIVDAGHLAKSTIVTKGSRQIGIIGITTPQLPYISSPRKVKADPDILGAVEAEEAKLQAAGVDIVILISHSLSAQEDMMLVGDLAGIDIIIAGGGGEVLGDPNDLYVPGDESAIYGPYPLYARDMAGTMVPVVTTAGDYRYVGRLVVGFDDAGNVTMVDDDLSKMVRVAGGDQPDAVAPDPFIQANVVDPVADYTAGLAQNVIGQSAVALDGSRSNVRVQETNEGNLVADALWWQATQLADQYGVPAPDIALQNGGGIRNNSVIPAGDITELTTFDIAPFGNFVAVVPDVTPADLKDILENAYSQIEQVGGRFAQVAGLQVVVDTSQQPLVWNADGTVATPGERVREVMLADGTLIVHEGQITAGARDVTVATINFLANGGDQYPHLQDFTVLGVSDQQALRNYIKDGLGGQITAADYPEGGEGRITLLP